MQPQAEQARIHVPVRQVDEDPARERAADQPVDARAGGEDGLEKAQPREHGLTGRLQRDAGADWAGVGHALDHRDVVAGASEQQRRGCGRRAAADDPNPVHWHRRWAYRDSAPRS